MVGALFYLFPIVRQMVGVPVVEVCFALASNPAGANGSVPVVEVGGVIPQRKTKAPTIWRGFLSGSLKGQRT